MVDIITNIAALRLRAGAAGTVGAVLVTVLGYSTVNDGGGGVFYWDGNDSTSTDDGATVVQVTGVSAGRWKLASEFIYQKNNPAFTGTGNRLVQTDYAGNLNAVNTVVDGFTADSDVITAITGATFNSSNNYTASLTPANNKIMYQGQMYVSGNYLYIATSDNTVKRLAGA
jgi:hypothetical protein